MELSWKTAFLICLNFVLLFGAPSMPPSTPSGPVGPTPTIPGTQQLDLLDAANLESLNRETRKTLLKIVGEELATARAMMKSIQPEVDNCQREVNTKYYDCVQCVDMNCQNRYKECNGSIQIVAPNSGGVSVSSSVSDRGLPVTTVCTVIWGQSEACTKVMNPDSSFATSINSMGNTLYVHLQSVAHDLGGNVGMFVNQMQTVVGDMNSTATNEEIERMLNELNFGLSGMQLELQNTLNGVENNVQQSMANVHQTVSQIQPNIDRIMSNINPGMRMTQMGSGLHQSLSNLGPSIRQQVNNNVGSMLYNLHHGLNRWRTNFGHSMNHFFSNLFGRKKRQAQVISHPSHEIQCEYMLKNSSVCAEYKTKCLSCPATPNVDDRDVIRQVCGDVIVDQVMQIDTKLAELANIEQMVVSVRQVIDQVEIDKALWNPNTFAFDSMFVTARIKGQPVRFRSKSELKIMDLKTTGEMIANQIWRYWNDQASYKPL